MENWKPDIPPSSSTVQVSVIDTTSYLGNVPAGMVLQPVYPGYDTFKIPSYSFLIHHKPTESRVLMDLGLRTNWRTHLSPHLLDEILPMGFDIISEKDTADILGEHGVSPKKINAVIFSHHHWDHVGDTTKFPSSTAVVVGPGYKEKYLPGWPTNPHAVDTTSDLYEGRETVEIDFYGEETLEIANFRAYDYFRDGSFYLLDAPGHTQGHLCALARTTNVAASEKKSSDGAGTSGVQGHGSDKEDTFIFLAGDSMHHCAVFRPSVYRPLPDEISPAPYDSNPHAMSNTSSGPGAMYAALHRTFKEGFGKNENQNQNENENEARTTALCIMPPDAPYDDDAEEVARTLDKILPFDGYENVFTIFAHDYTLLPIIDFFPQTANQWKANGWKIKAHWRFLGPLKVH